MTTTRTVSLVLAASGIALTSQMYAAEPPVYLSEIVRITEASVEDDFEIKSVEAVCPQGMSVISGGSRVSSIAPVSDVLAIALWMGKRSQVGRATGRMYRNVGNRKPAWIDPRDVAAMPTLFQPMKPPPPPPPPPVEESKPAAQPMNFTDFAHEIGKQLAKSDGVKPYRPLTKAAAPLTWREIIEMADDKICS